MTWSDWCLFCVGYRISALTVQSGQVSKRDRRVSKRKKKALLSFELINDVKLKIEKKYSNYKMSFTGGGNEPMLWADRDIDEQNIYDHNKSPTEANSSIYGKINNEQKQQNNIYEVNGHHDQKQLNGIYEHHQPLQQNGIYDQQQQQQQQQNGIYDHGNSIDHNHVAVTGASSMDPNAVYGTNDVNGMYDHSSSYDSSGGATAINADANHIYEHSPYDQSHQSVSYSGQQPQPLDQNSIYERAGQHVTSGGENGNTTTTSTTASPDNMPPPPPLEPMDHYSDMTVRVGSLDHMSGNGGLTLTSVDPSLVDHLRMDHGGSSDLLHHSLNHNHYHMNHTETSLMMMAPSTSMTSGAGIVSAGDHDLKLPTAKERHNYLRKYARKLGLNDRGCYIACGLAALAFLLFIIVVAMGASWPGKQADIFAKKAILSSILQTVAVSPFLPSLLEVSDFANNLERARKIPLLSEFISCLESLLSRVCIHKVCA